MYTFVVIKDVVSKTGSGTERSLTAPSMSILLRIVVRVNIDNYAVC